MLSEIYYTRVNAPWFHLYEVSKTVMFVEAENSWWVPGEQGKGEMRSCSIGIK